MENNRQFDRHKEFTLLSNKLPDYPRDPGLSVATANDTDVGLLSSNHIDDTLILLDPTVCR